MRRLKAMPRPTAAEAVKALYLVVKRKCVDQREDNRKQQREKERGPAGPSSYISRVPDDMRVVRVVFWIAHNARPKIIHACLSKNFVQLAAVPALMNFLQLHQDMQWDRWDEYQCTWTTNWTVHDKFWVSWGVSTILGRVHQPDPKAHERVGGVVGLPGLGHELTRLEMKFPGMVHDPTPIVVHVLEEGA
ncbi:hypothetical protein EWM64_g3804 [Hericium alpestre]|uniref:Uncharacterized protein n=1 Tax=Hericium alpestre TaxID=135208 RepID=A0A4Z0A2W6_9AGAM|nr:hypothetical protein EWM64_g3804 [Hericium alpestre]